mmetsp:Transcript_30399/g.50159  ORF Transcript_30399/g.50159 Transcript_30399/m.50159 type:complete len:215 (+) Transcript_30399:401-1045(+)
MSTTRTRTRSLRLTRFDFVFHGNTLLRYTVQKDDAFRCHAHLSRQLINGRISVEFRLQITLIAAHIVQLIVNVNRQSNSTRLVGNGSSNRLLDPPGRICGKAKATFGVKAFARLGQTQNTLLRQILNAHTAILVALGNGNDQANVGLGQGSLGAEASSNLFLHLGNCHVRANTGGPFSVGWWTKELRFQFFSLLFPLHQDLNFSSQNDFLILIQ